MSEQTKISHDDFKELKDLEEKLWKATTRFDKNWMNEILSRDFFEIGLSGRTYSKEMTIACEFSEIPISFPLSDFKIRLIAKNVALITYISSVNYPTGLEKGLRSSLWCKRNGKWKLEFHQGTPIYSALT